MAKKYNNRNDNTIRILDELKDEIEFKKYEYKEKFKYICNLIPNDPRERLDIEEIDKESCNREGIVYIFVIGGRIFKIGHSINTIKKRVGSYNTGKEKYRRAGTNSTTNNFILQSLLKLNKKIEVYGFFPELAKFRLLGEDYETSYQPAKKAENIFIEKFIKKYNKKPIGCTQK